MQRQKPQRHVESTIEMMLSSKRVRLSVYVADVASLDGSYHTNVELTKVERDGPLLTIENPQYKKVIDSHEHLRGVHVLDEDQKEKLPVHVVLGKDVYARIKTPTKPRLGGETDPIAELTRFGWFIMSPGQEFDVRSVMLTQANQYDYEQLCRTDVLGLADAPEHSQTVVHAEFKEQLTRSPEGWYETGLPWKGNHPTLPTNEEGSQRRLKSLLLRLKRNNLTSEYDDIIREQLESGVIEPAPTTAQGTEFYIPHKAVVRETAATTKVRIVYDASAKVNPDAPSLNDCLYAGPPLQNRLWDVLIQQRAYPVVVSGDIAKAFLQVRIREGDRDALRFHWRDNNEQLVKVYRFTRALFGLTSSPFLLGGVLEAHLETWAAQYPEESDLLRRSLYVDDLLTGGSTVEEAQQRKEFAVRVMTDATFKLHKWNSNATELEASQPGPDTEQSYAKQELGTRAAESKLLGESWSKQNDTIRVELPSQPSPPTKRGVLGQLARIYDPLGIASPISLQGKMLYRKACDQKLGWDNELPNKLLEEWRSWERRLPSEVVFPRPIGPYQEKIEDIQLHAFGDASAEGVGAAVYSVVTQKSGVTSSLVAAKARLAKQGLTIPRLELIGAHMAANLLTNVRGALQDQPVSATYGWSDSTVVLHWLKGGGQYRQFVTNRVTKINQHDVEWRHVPTDQNPADLASRGSSISTSQMWSHGPTWLSNPTEWPTDPVITSTTESEKEAKTIRQVMRSTRQIPSEDFDLLLAKYPLRKVLRIQTYLRRFRTRNRGPITTEESQRELTWWIQRAQERDRNESYHEATAASLNLQPNSEGVLVCRGRIQGKQPIYIPYRSGLARSIVQRRHLQTLHGGVSLTMAAVREDYWIPRLRSLVKAVRKDCNGCRRFQAAPMQVPAPGNLPTDRTSPGGAFEVIGVDNAGPIRHRAGRNREAKAYILLWTCSLSRAVQLELLPNLSTEEFVQAFKKLIARRGRPRIIYSDNGGAFVAANKWLRNLRREEKLMGLLEDHEISWRFNLSRAPWWGGQFERLVAVIKGAFYKTVGGGTLTWTELAEVILDVETQINRRPLTYVEDDVQLPLLTPQTFLYQRSTQLPEQATHQINDLDLRSRAKYLKSCKDQLWKRWEKEYLVALRERHNLAHKKPKYQPEVGDVVIVKSDSKNRGVWPLGIVVSLHPGKDDIVRAIGVRTPNGHIERAPQHLYPLELHCDSQPPALNPQAEEFTPRPKRDAAVAASRRIQDIAEIETQAV